jgi:ABC-type phosphate transport system substrate-binding protein
MRRRNKILVLLALFGMMSVSIHLHAQSNVQLIGNKTGFENLPLKEARQIFKAKYSVWSSGIAVTIVLPSPKHPNADQVCKLIYENSVSGVQKFWLSLVFQGRANPPLFFDSDDEIINYVNKNPGAIGIVSKDNIKSESKFTINLVY